jgi:hypothetical protein
MKRVVLVIALGALVGSAADAHAKKLAYNLPPAQRLLEPGPGVGGPGPGVIPPMGQPSMGPGGGVAAAGFAGGGGMVACGPGGGGPMGPALSQVAFLGVEGGQIAWDISGQGLFDSTPLVMPGRQNFYQGAMYRLKLTDIPGRPGVELYPSLEVAPVTPRTDEFLAHAPIPVQVTEEDLDQVLSGNYVTKVIYLPDPEFQELALAGVETLVSTRLNPGEDPIVEADRRGSILAILRIGNLDLQLPGQNPSMAAGPGVTPAQYELDPSMGYEGEAYQGEAYQGESYGGESYGGESYGGESYEGSPPYAAESYGSGTMAPPACGPDGAYGGGEGYVGAGGPQGMPTSGFAPQAMPPHMVSGVNGPQYGMPYVGTPIGLPGPPHIPLGHQAGLVSHTMKNRTKILMPPPVHDMKITVKQRPGMNYPRPVNHVRVDEVNRAGFRMFGGTVPPLWRTLSDNWKQHKLERCHDPACLQCPEGEACQSEQGWAP